MCRLSGFIQRNLNLSNSILQFTFSLQYLKMEILRVIKNNEPITNNLALGLFSCLQIQLLALFIINQDLPMYSNILNFITTNSPVQKLTIFIFVLHLIQIIYIILKYVVSLRIKGQRQQKQKSRILRFIEIKPYIFYIQIMNINSIGIKHENKFIIFASLFNILFVIAEVLVLRVVNVSYRFVQNNNIRRKNNSILHWVLIFPVIITLHYYSQFYGSIILLFRSCIQMYFNYHNLQTEEIRYLDWFFPLITSQLTFILFIEYYLGINVTNNLIFFSFILIFGIFCSKNISEVLSSQVLKYHLKKSNHVFDNQSKQVNRGIQQTIQLHQDQMHKILLQLRIMVKIYVSKIKYDSVQSSQQQNSDNFNYWWNFWDTFILLHKVSCNNVTCLCTKFIRRSKQNSIIQKRIFADKIYLLIKKLQNQCSTQTKKLKIIQNYFLIQLEKKPLKTYYQLIKLFSGSLNRQQILQVQNLMLQTRVNFKQFFIKQKVQNSELDIQPLIQFQKKIKNMRVQLNQMAVQYRKFYQIFASNFVQMDTLKNQTRTLSKFKHNFRNLIDSYLIQYDKSIQLMTFSLIYFTFFDQYTTKLDRLQTKAQYLLQYYLHPRSSIKKQVVQIFHPGFGAVKADLVFQPGKIISISKNLCHALGFSHRQVSNQKINKIMPYMFARYHDKFLKNFVEKGSAKMLKYKQKVYYSKAANKFIVPISIRLKIDYSSYQNMYAITLIRPTPTKSQFIIMNNYGKIEQMSGGIYKKMFQKVFTDQIVKTKRLSACKMLLTLNYYLKDATENDETVHEGLFLTAQDQNVLMSYYKFPDFGITPKKVQDNQTSNKNLKSSNTFQPTSSASYNGTMTGSSEVDFSQDMNAYCIDMKEAIKDYIKKLDLEKVVGRRVTYKIQDYVTNQFKCKILQIINIKDQIRGKQLQNSLKTEIIDISEHFGLQENQYSRFKDITLHEKTKTLDIYQLKLSKKKSLASGEVQQYENSTNNLIEQQDAKVVAHNQPRGDSDASSVISTNQVIKKKQTIINAFQKKTIVNSGLQYGLTFLIIAMALVLVIICIFSMRLQGNYQKLQHDNLTIMNFRIDFLLRLGIQQLQNVYNNYNVPQPAFLQAKKQVVQNKMKNYLKNTIKWIDISWDGYLTKMPLVYADQKYTQNRSIYFFMRQFYAVWVGHQQLGRYFADNYVSLANYLVGLGNNEQVLIANKSLQFKSQIDIVVIIYSCILFFVLVVATFLLKISSKKQTKIIDFLPFLKSKLANQKAIFYQRFYQYNKESQNIQIQSIEQIYQSQQIIQSKQKKTLKMQNQVTTDANSKLIRIVNNQKSGISLRIILMAILVIALCAFVIFFSEYFFDQSQRKFAAYLKLKNSAMLVQLAPSRLLMLYFININKLLTNQTILTFPASYSGLAHDRLFQLRTNLANKNYYGSEMEQIIDHHFTKQICELVKCPQDQSELVRNQQVFFLSYRYVNAFNYMRATINKLPFDKNPRITIQKFMDENNVWQILHATQYVLDLIKKDQQQITNLFSDQISEIGLILFFLSLTQIPILIVVMLYVRKKYIEYISDKLECTQNVYKHISWNMLSDNTYAINYFQDKLKKAKQY